MDFNEFKKDNIAVHCDTEKKAKDFFNECIKHGINKWLDSDYLDINDIYWENYKQNTCYCFCRKRNWIF